MKRIETAAREIDARFESAYWLLISSLRKMNHESAMVTSTSTPGSILMEVICFTISDGEWRSISRLWIRIWNRSQVLEPSPHGVLRVVMRRILVGIRTGPFTFSCLSLAPLIRSAHTFSKLFTLRLVSVMRILWMGASSAGAFWSPLAGYADILFSFWP